MEFSYVWDLAKSTEQIVYVITLTLRLIVSGKMQLRPSHFSPKDVGILSSDTKALSLFVGLLVPPKADKFSFPVSV